MTNGLTQVWKFDNRWELLIHRIFFRSTGLTTYRLDGLEFVVDHKGGDENGTRACLVSDMYRGLVAAMKFDGPVTLLDIGANGGGFPLMLKASGLTLRKVAAVELNPRTFGRMQLNVVQNLDAETMLVSGAICGEPCTLDVRLGRGDTGDSFDSGDGADTRRHIVEGITFDQFYERAFGSEPVDLCKMDIEGAEHAIFAGNAYRSLARCRYLIIEIHEKGDHRAEPVRAAIEALGFVEMPGSRKSHHDVYCYENRRIGSAPEAEVERTAAFA
ncbi:MAG TPA: FkbM family methyltransferase [Sphingomonas sp.]|nr:FkbM family methyltransferase [Sphingomonas sp.]